MSARELSLLKALRDLVATFRANMNEAEDLEHMLDNHNPDECALCSAEAEVA